MLDSWPGVDAAATAVLLLSGEGTVLARSGPAEMLGPPRAAIGHADLPTYFRGESGEDLLGLVNDAANADTSGPFMVRVLAERASSKEPILLTLHPVAPGLVVGVLSYGQKAPSGADYAVNALRMVWDGLAEGIAVAIPDGPDRIGRIMAANGPFASMFGLCPDDVVGLSLGHFLAPLNGAVFAKRVDEEVMAEGRSISDLTMSQKGPSAERTLLDWELGPVRAQDGRVLGVIAVLRDTTHAPRAASRKRSDLDPSSGLPNQSHLLNRIERSVERAAQARAYTFAVIGLEMRGLRALERRLGTLVANTALEALVRRLEQRLRPTDLVARTGDRRLAILLDHFAPWGALDDVLDRIRVVTDAPYTIAGERMTMSAIGTPGPIWSGDDPAVTPHDVLRTLETSVTRARADTARPSGRAKARTNGDTFELSSAVRKAQLTLRYLPLVSLEDGKVAGLEALVRWSRPEHGTVPGHGVIHQAERQGLIAAIGEWVWGEALRQVREWDAMLPPGQVAPVHLNLSASEFWIPDLAGELERRALNAMVDPSRVRLEIPESAIARRTPAAHHILEELASAGFEPWLDRFGEGGMQLRDLDSLPFGNAKLTPSIAWSSNGNAGRPRAMLGSLLALGHDIGWRVTVAGVETAGQAEALTRVDCDLGQGFFYHGLLDAAQAAAVMRHSRDGESHRTTR